MISSYTPHVLLAPQHPKALPRVVPSGRQAETQPGMAALPGWMHTGKKVGFVGLLLEQKSKKCSMDIVAKQNELKNEENCSKHEMLRC